MGCPYPNFCLCGFLGPTIVIYFVLGLGCSSKSPAESFTKSLSQNPYRNP